VAKAEARACDQLELIGDLLDLAHIQQATQEANVESVDAASVLRDVVDMMQAEIDAKSLDLAVERPPSGAPVRASEDHIKQVWTNLVSNAVKYTPEGGKVRASVSVEGDHVVGSVRDSGIGIAPEDLDRIFENFYRTQAAKEMARHGTGLGLSIVKGIVHHYGGRIWVESELGKGSKFSFELPLANMRQEAAPG
jgi:signal transduction histidine kinase